MIQETEEKALVSQALEARKLEVQPLLNGGSRKRTAFPLCLGFTYIASTRYTKVFPPIRS